MLASELLKLPYEEMHLIMESETKRMLDSAEKKARKEGHKEGHKEGLIRLASLLGATKEQLEKLNQLQSSEEIEHQFLFMIKNQKLN